VGKLSASERKVGKEKGRTAESCNERPRSEVQRVGRPDPQDEIDGEGGNDELGVLQDVEPRLPKHG
jgi:hypothetical protein